MFIVVHVQGRVLRLIEASDLANAEAKARLAVQCTPRAGFELVQGELPSDIEAYADEYKTRYLDREADAFLLAHRDTDLPDEPTRVERPSGLQRKVSLVEN
jgi:hypothetical protein